MRLTAPSRAVVSAVLLAVASSTACEDPPAPPPPEPRAVEPPAPPPDPLYDAEGRLRETGDRFAGVPIPVGFERATTAREGELVLRSTRVPSDKVAEFFGPRLFTGQIERRGAVLVYRKAVPMDRRDQQQRVDVRIRPGDDGLVMVQLYAHPLPPLVTPSMRELERTLRQEQKRIE